MDTTGHRCFALRNLHTPVLGRAAELAALAGFLRAPDRFAWWLLSGAGGAGKTRLALPLTILAHRQGWRAATTRCCTRCGGG